MRRKELGYVGKDASIEWGRMRSEQKELMMFGGERERKEWEQGKLKPF